MFTADVSARKIKGLLVPFNEASRTNATGNKPVLFKGAEDVKLPRDVRVVGLNRRHNRFDPVGHAATLIPQEAGVFAEFDVADTPEGDYVLAHPDELPRLSPELRNIVRRPDGSGSAELTGASLVEVGAFASAGLFAIGEVEDEEPVEDPAPANLVPNPNPEPDPAPAEVDPAPATVETDPAPVATSQEENVTIPNTLKDTKTPAGAPAAPSKGEMFSLLSAVQNGRATPEILNRLRAGWAPFSSGEAGLFALADVPFDGVGGVGSVMAPAAQWLGEVLDGTTYVQRYAPLFGQKSLTSRNMTGWRWTTKPKGGTWAGNKSDVPSNTPAVELVTEGSARWAGGHDHAREHVDFGTPGYFESYYAAMTEDFLRWLDEIVVLAEALAAATDIEADNPGGLAIGAGMSQVIDGAAAVVEAGLIPSFAVLDTPIWKSILKTPKSDTLGYLDAALGFEKGTLENSGFILRPSAEITTGHVLVGAKSAADVYTLPGSPIRAEALDLSRGGVDTAMFGYGGLLVTNPAGIVDVAPYTA